MIPFEAFPPYTITKLRKLLYHTVWWTDCSGLRFKSVIHKITIDVSGVGVCLSSERKHAGGTTLMNHEVLITDVEWPQKLPSEPMLLELFRTRAKLNSARRKKGTCSKAPAGRLAPSRRRRTARRSSA